MESTTVAPHTPMVETLIFDHLLGLKEFDTVLKHENAVKPIGMFFVMEVQMKTQDFQKHWMLPYRLLRNTVWMGHI